MPIEFPEGVEAKVDGQTVEVIGKLGTLTQTVPEELEITLEDNVLTLERSSEEKAVKSLHGLYRSLIENMVEGVTEGYSITLEIIGTGYRAIKNGKVLDLQLGFSHPLELEDPEGIEVEVPNQTTMIVKGIDKQAVGQYAAQLRSYRKPEPYKGKGVRYKDEHVIRKAGKAGA